MSYSWAAQPGRRPRAELRNLWPGGAKASKLSAAGRWDVGDEKSGNSYVYKQIYQWHGTAQHVIFTLWITWVTWKQASGRTGHAPSSIRKPSKESRKPTIAISTLSQNRRLAGEEHSPCSCQRSARGSPSALTSTAYN